MLRLFDYGFDQFTYVTVISPLYPLAQITVNNSAASQVVSLAPAAGDPAAAAEGL